MAVGEHQDAVFNTALTWPSVQPWRVPGQLDRESAGCTMHRKHDKDVMKRRARIGKPTGSRDFPCASRMARDWWTGNVR